METYQNSKYNDDQFAEQRESEENENGTGIENGGNMQNNLLDNNHQPGAMSPEQAGVYNSIDPIDDDEDLDADADVDDDDDMDDLDDDDDDETTDEVEDADETLNNDEEKEDTDPRDPVTSRFSTDADFSNRNHGRTSGRMEGHEPGLDGGI